LLHICQKEGRGGGRPPQSNVPPHNSSRGHNIFELQFILYIPWRCTLQSDSRFAFLCFRGCGSFITPGSSDCSKVCPFLHRTAQKNGYINFLAQIVIGRRHLVSSTSVVSFVTWQRSVAVTMIPKSFSSCRTVFLKWSAVEYWYNYAYTHTHHFIALQKYILCSKRGYRNMVLVCRYVHFFSIKVKVVPVLQLSTTPWRHIGEWRCTLTHSWPQHYGEVSGELRTPAASPPGIEPLVPIRRLGGAQSRSGHLGEEILVILKLYIPTIIGPPLVTGCVSAVRWQL
jgi:hypothetical protein